ncbi:MAG TPA: hypothetical protein VGC89_16870 [Pyrinomonadaceae bacterium]
MPTAAWKSPPTAQYFAPTKGQTPRAMRNMTRTLAYMTRTLAHMTRTTRDMARTKRKLRCAT